MLQIYVDADGCPVKREVYRVAKRYGLAVTLVANAWMRVPEKAWLTLVVVGDDFDAADDWIADRAGPGDIVITADLPLAKRCLAAGARVLGHKGRELTDDTIGEALAGREIRAHLRDLGVATGGPAPLDKKDRSRFLQRLDALAGAAARDG